MRSCEALVYDVLVAPELVEEAPEDALLIPREKIRQPELNELLVDLGRQGLDVVRLKGGDPFVFGRGGEEALALAAADVPFEVVPGVSALSAVPASAGIPITHRGLSAQVTLVSGHSAKGEELDFDHLARTPGTLVVFMGVAHLERIAAGLSAAGKDPATPAAVVARGTHADGESVTGELHEIAELAADLRLAGATRRRRRRRGGDATRRRDRQARRARSVAQRTLGAEIDSTPGARDPGCRISHPEAKRSNRTARLLSVGSPGLTRG